jgi:hypothetical protein
MHKKSTFFTLIVATINTLCMNVEKNKQHRLLSKTSTNISTSCKFKHLIHSKSSPSLCTNAYSSISILTAENRETILAQYIKDEEMLHFSSFSKETVEAMQKLSKINSYLEDYLNKIDL